MNNPEIEITLQQIGNINVKECLSVLVHSKIKDKDTTCFHNVQFKLMLKQKDNYSIEKIKNLSLQKTKEVCQMIIDQIR